MKKTGRARILVIDDDEGIRIALSTVLIEKGYEVDVAATGHEAIAKSKANFYNLALVDLPARHGRRKIADRDERNRP